MFNKMATKKINTNVMGKVTVIKSFALPKLVLQFTALPNQPNKIITGITWSMFFFKLYGTINQTNQKRTSI